MVDSAGLTTTQDESFISRSIYSDFDPREKQTCLFQPLIFGVFFLRNETNPNLQIILIPTCLNSWAVLKCYPALR